MELSYGLHETGLAQSDVRFAKLLTPRYFRIRSLSFKAQLLGLVQKLWALPSPREAREKGLRLAPVSS